MRHSHLPPPCGNCPPLHARVHIVCVYVYPFPLRRPCSGSSASTPNCPRRCLCVPAHCRRPSPPWHTPCAPPHRESSSPPHRNGPASPPSFASSWARVRDVWVAVCVRGCVSVVVCVRCTCTCMCSCAWVCMCARAGHKFAKWASGLKGKKTVVPGPLVACLDSCGRRLLALEDAYAVAHTHAPLSRPHTPCVCVCV